MRRPKIKTRMEKYPNISRVSSAQEYSDPDLTVDLICEQPVLDHESAGSRLVGAYDEEI